MGIGCNEEVEEEDDEEGVCDGLVALPLGDEEEAAAERWGE
jgi:hypothetical protein